jgi:hypothetical protein
MFGYMKFIKNSQYYKPFVHIALSKYGIMF